MTPWFIGFDFLVSKYYIRCFECRHFDSLNLSPNDRENYNIFLKLDFIGYSFLSRKGIIGMTFEW